MRLGLLIGFHCLCIMVCLLCALINHNQKRPEVAVMCLLVALSGAILLGYTVCTS